MRYSQTTRLCSWSTLALVALAGCEPSAERDHLSGDTPPNVLLIVADDLGYADLGAYGSDIRTPNIDALASEGILFTQFHAAPSCGPTRAMLMTGNNNHVAGTGRQNTFIEGLPGYENRLSDRVVPFPRLLAEAGYHTSMAGKWHLGNAPEEGPQTGGFERYWSLINGAGSHFSGTGFFEGGSTYRADGVEVEWPEGAYSTEWYTDRILDFMGEAREQERPFFVFGAYTSPHWPLQVPDDYLDRYEGHYDEGYDVWRERNFDRLQTAGIIPATTTLPPRNDALTPWTELSPDDQRSSARAMELYAAMVENLDHHVGRLVSWLKDNGQYENTVIVFMSDNGAAYEDFYNRGDYVEYLRANYDNSPQRMGRAGSWVSYDAVWGEAGSAPFSRRKTYSREGGLVAPMIVRGPTVSARGVIEDAYVTVMDLAPTFLEMAGASYPQGGSVRPMLGESMTGLLAGTDDRVHSDDYVTTLYHAGRGFVRRGQWKLVSLDPPFRIDGMQLFDVIADPGETEDLREAEPEIHAEMLALWSSEKERLGIRLESERPAR